MRRDLDFYETASWQVDALVDHVPELVTLTESEGLNILCPCIGDGSLLQQLMKRKVGSDCSTNDIDLEREADFHFDARGPELYGTMIEEFRIAPDFVIDNPPFNIEIDILMEAYKHVRYGVIFMSRLSFTEPTDDSMYKGVKRTGRGPWLKEHPMFKQIVLERYSFTGDGASDSVTTAWNVWLKPGVQLSNPGVFSAYGYRP